MTTEQWATNTIIKRIILLLCLALLLAWCCFFTWKTDNLLFNILTVAVTVLIYILILRKSRVLKILRDRNRKGTVVALKNITLTERRYNTRGRGSWNYYKTFGYEITVDVREEEPLVYRVSHTLIRPGSICVGDRIQHFRGAKYPYNLTRKTIPYACPFCGRDRFNNKCPDCRVKF